MTEHDPLALLRDATQATPTDVERLRDALPQDLALTEPPVQTRRWWPVGAALAAGLLLAVGWWAQDRSPPDAPPALPRPVDVGLAHGAISLGPGIQLSADGQGRVSGTDHDARIDWETGTLVVEVDPAAQVRVVVQTEEAQVQVLGTRFTVVRDATGTRVDLERGAVAVACHDAETQLTPGQSHTCPTMTAARWLLHARQASAPDAILDATTQGLAAAPSAAVEGELRVVRLQVLLDQGRHADALAEIQAYIALPVTPRRDEVCAHADALGSPCP